MHIVTEDDVERAIRIINHMKTKLNDLLQKNEQLLVLNLGDLADFYCYNSEQGCAPVKTVLDYLVESLSSWQTSYEFVPGNHDMGYPKFERFDGIVSTFTDTQYHYSKNHIISKDICGNNFLFVNTSFHGDHEFGNIDFDDLDSKILSNKCNILVCHHSILSEDQNDKACIKGITRLLRNKNMRIILNGHTHGDFSVKIDHIHKIGIGSIFKIEENINNQFNLIDLDNRGNAIVKNYRYHKDIGKFVEFRTPELANAISILKSRIDESIYIPENYIERKLRVLNSNQANNMNTELINNSLDAILTLKKVILLSDAGFGKTFEMQKVAYQLIKQDSGYVPITCKLNRYNGESIEDMIPEQYRSIGYENLMFLFDGYDEIESTKAIDFRRSLYSYLDKNEGSYILVTSRTNFYSNEIDNRTKGSLDGFYELEFKQFDLYDIELFLKLKNINKESFIDYVTKIDGLSLMYNPFYLSEIVELFSDKMTISSRSELMKEMIKRRFRNDESKYGLTTQLEDMEYDIQQQLKTIALSLQLMKTNTMSNSEYQQLIDSKYRQIIRYNGVWHKDSEKMWSFVHNNFREYLVAELISEFSLEEKINLITFTNNKNKIKSTWINIISFLLSKEDEEFANWLVNIDPSILIKFEPNYINEKERYNIVHKLLEDLKSKNMWFSIDGVLSEDIIRFGESSQLITYLLNEIQNPVHFRAQYNSLLSLSLMKNNYGLKGKIGDVIFECLVSSETRNHEKKEALLCLIKHEFSDKNVQLKLLDLFKYEYNEEIRYGMYRYFIEFQLCDDYIHFFIDGLRNKLIVKDDGSYLNEQMALKEGIKSIKTSKALLLVIQFFTEGITNNSYNDDDLVIELIDKAISLYSDNEDQIFISVRDLYLSNYISFYSKKSKELKLFFEKTATLFKMYEYVLLDFESNMKLYILEELMSKIEIDDFILRYINDKLTNNLFIDYAFRLRPNNYQYDYIKEIIKEKENISLPIREEIDYTSIKAKGRQKLFESLFDISIFAELICDLLLMTNENLTYSELRDIDDNTFNNRYDLKKITWRLSKVNFKDNRVSSFTKLVSWEDFSIAFIYDLIKNDKENFVLTKTQLNYVHKYCTDKLSVINIIESITYENESTKISFVSMYIAFFISKFNLAVNSSLLLDLLYWPNFIFAENPSYEKEFPIYLTAQIDKNLLTKRVKENIASLTLHGHIAQVHIEYCRANNLDYAIKLAMSVVKELNSGNVERRDALIYLESMIGINFIIENYLCSDDEKLGNLVIENFRLTKNKYIMEEMIQRNKKSDNKKLYLIELIEMESEYGLDVYINLAKENNSIPDYSGPDSGSFNELTESISKISEITLLPQLSELIELLFKEGFIDSKYFGLYNSLTKAIRNLAHHNYNQVADFLKKKLIGKTISIELVSFCNYLLKDIENTYFNNEDKPLSISEVKKYLKAKL